MNNTNRNPHLDPSLRAIEDALDSLGAAERARAHGALEQDILRATRAARAGAPHRASRFRILGELSPSLRLAAGVGLAATIGLVAFVALRTSTSTAHQFAAVEQDLDSFLTAADADPALVIDDSSLVDLRASIAAAEESLDDFWAVPDDTADPLGSNLENSL